jgi:hypothetical protein
MVEVTEWHDDMFFCNFKAVCIIKVFSIWDKQCYSFCTLLSEFVHILFNCPLLNSFDLNDQHKINKLSPVIFDVLII